MLVIMQINQFPVIFVVVRAFLFGFPFFCIRAATSSNGLGRLRCYQTKTHNGENAIDVAIKINKRTRYASKQLNAQHA